MNIVDVFKKVAAMDEFEVLEDFSKRFGAVFSEFYAYKDGDEQLPLLVAHADTVAIFPPRRNEVLYDPRRKVLIRKPSAYGRHGGEPLGADDRLGVAMIYLLLQEFPNAAALLLNYEESGGYGARQAASLLKEEISKYPFLLELDRSGCKHFAHYGHITYEFTDFLSQILPGWQLKNGSFTDITILCPAAKRCGVNIAIGYYNQHTSLEYVELQHTYKALHAVKKLLSNPVSKPFVYEEPKFLYDDEAWSYYDYDLFEWKMPELDENERFVDTEEWLKDWQF